MSKWFAGFLALLLAVLLGVYYWLDPKTKVLDSAERERLGGSYVQLSDGVTHYALSGPTDGEVVVLVHGGTVPMLCWEKQAAALTAAGYRVLMYDQFGRSFYTLVREPKRILGFG